MFDHPIRRFHSTPSATTRESRSAIRAVQFKHMHFVTEVPIFDHDSAAQFRKLNRVIRRWRCKPGALASCPHCDQSLPLRCGFFGGSVAHGLPCTVRIISVRTQIRPVHESTLQPELVAVHRGAFQAPPPIAFLLCCHCARSLRVAACCCSTAYRLLQMSGAIRWPANSRRLLLAACR